MVRAKDDGTDPDVRQHDGAQDERAAAREASDGAPLVPDAASERRQPAQGAALTGYDIQ